MHTFSGYSIKLIQPGHLVYILYYRKVFTLQHPLFIIGEPVVRWIFTFFFLFSWLIKNEKQNGLTKIIDLKIAQKFSFTYGKCLWYQDLLVIITLSIIIGKFVTRASSHSSQRIVYTPPQKGMDAIRTITDGDNDLTWLNSSDHFQSKCQCFRRDKEYQCAIDNHTCPHLAVTASYLERMGIWPDT